MKKLMMISTACMLVAVCAVSCGKSAKTDAESVPETVATVIGEEIDMSESDNGADTETIAEGTAIVIDTNMK